jgi:hypothetical protein
MGYAITGSLARHPRPPIRFLFIGSHLCSALLPAPPHGECVSPLRFAITSRPSRCEEGLHLQAVKHAGHTNQKPGLIGAGLGFLAYPNIRQPRISWNGPLS